MYPVGYVVGVFDLFHRGHKLLLTRALAICDSLVVYVHTDAFAESYKRRPVQDQDQREAQVKSFLPEGTVTGVVGGDHSAVYATHGVTHVIHGDDWDEKGYREQLGEAALREHQVQVVLLPATAGICSSDLMKIASCSLVVFDIDGTLAIGETALPGAVEAVERALSAGKQVVCITNDTGVCVQEKSYSLRRLGFPNTVTVRSPLDSVARAVASSGYKAAAVFGSITVTGALRGSGVSTVLLHDHSASPDVVIVCRFPGFTVDDLNRVCHLVASGVPYLVANGDRYYPSADGPSVDGAGLIAIIEATTGQQPQEVFGKPQTSMLQDLCDEHKADQVLVVGDRLQTDIRMANALGCISAHVETGDGTPCVDVVPTLTLAGVGELASLFGI